MLNGNTESGLYSSYYMSRMPKLRLLFAIKGLKGFLIGIDGIDKITDKELLFVRQLYVRKKVSPSAKAKQLR